MEAALEGIQVLLRQRHASPLGQSDLLNATRTNRIRESNSRRYKSIHIDTTSRINLHLIVDMNDESCTIALMAHRKSRKSRRSRKSRKSRGMNKRVAKSVKKAVGLLRTALRQSRRR
jgi:hypothetical protein